MTPRLDTPPLRAGAPAPRGGPRVHEPKPAPGAAVPSTRTLLPHLLALVAVAAVSLAPLSAQETAEDFDFRESPFLRVDPEKIAMEDGDPRRPCGTCHEAAFEVWRETSHATGFETMHKSESARSILQAMDMRVTKRQEALCMRCHYTVKAPGLKAIAGVSCESCHGPARDWLTIHNDWGDGVEHPDQETPEHRRQRIEQATAAGMLRPSQDLYAVAANCFECHTVPWEDLVNTGGHKAGSGSFDLVEWSGRIRHNFVHRQWGDDSGNREPSQERKRAMLLLDRILKYEFGLRGMARASEDGSYSKSMERRTKEAYKELDAIATLVEMPELDAIVEAGSDLSIVPDNPGPLLEAADEIRSVARDLSADLEERNLAPLDPLFQGAKAEILARRKAGPADPQLADPEPETPSQPAATGEARTAAGGGGSSGGAGGGEAAAPTPAELPGSVRSRPAWFPSFDTEYHESPDCSGCHEVAANWIYEDAHAESNVALLNQTPKARQIATLYGIGATGMTKGDQICMSCHGTKRTATPVDIWDPVTCESCHGPAADYYKKHKRGGNPQLGMRNLKDAQARAENCSRCHIISDERLLAAGHPSGEGYDFVQANATIEHWPDNDNLDRDGPYPAVADGALASAWSSIASSRPVPDVQVVAVAPPRPTASRPATGGGGGAETAARPTGGGGGGAATGGGGARAASPRPAVDVKPRGAPAVSSIPPTSPRTLPPSTAGPDVEVNLQSVPDSTAEMTTEDLMLLLKRRLEALYRLLGRGG